MEIRKRNKPALLILIVAALLGLHPVITVAQDPFRVMDWKTEYTLRTNLLQQMHDQYNQRRDRLASSLSGQEALNRYREECRSGFLNILGINPGHEPLNATVTGRVSLDDFMLEKIILESKPGHHITTSLYLPAGEGPFPGLLFLCGHEMTSKATASYQEAAMLFAQNGFAVLVVDPISQGERVQFTDSNGNRILRGSTTEHTLLDAGAILTGTSVAAIELEDNVRALDYLISRSEIDQERIGCIGNSGGGAQAMYLTGFDNRIKVAVPCSFITSREREYEMNGTGDGCQQMPYEGMKGLEIADYLSLFAPRPLLILAGRYDFVDYQGTLDAFAELKSVYSTLGFPERVSLFTCDDGHGLSAPKREAALTWFRRWLAMDTTTLRTGAAAPPDERTTWCTPAGQVNAMFRNEVTVQAVNSNRINELETARQVFCRSTPPEAVRDTLRSLLAVSNAGDRVWGESAGTGQINGRSFEKLILRSNREVPLPCIVFSQPGVTGGDTIVICLSREGKSAAVTANGNNACPGFSEKILIAADLRGMGETAEKPQANDPKYYNSEYHNAVLGMHIGRPLPGQRVTDILIILEYTGNKDELHGLPVKIIASGPAAPAALMAAFLDDRIVSLELSSTIRSFREITDNPVEKDWFSYIIPGIMQYFDLPDLAALRPELKIRYTDR
jgi:hypothetical protein